MKRRQLVFFFTALLVIALAAGCGGHSPTFVPAPRSASGNTSRAKPPLLLAGRTRFVGVGVGQRKPAVQAQVAGPVTKLPSSEQLLALSKQTTPQAIPNPEPTSWCPEGASSTNNCAFIQPSSYDQDILYCVNCTSQMVPTVNIYINPSYTPPPNFSVRAVSSTGQTALDCGTPGANGGPSCTLTTCYQPYPACYVDVEYIANEGTAPANVVTTDEIEEPGYCCAADFNNWWTVTPEVVDDDITSGYNVVTWPYPTPSPIMVGNEVRLEASPAAALSSATWNFDSTSITDIVGSYGWIGNPAASPTAIPSMAAPSPVASGTNPTRFYWLSGDSSNWAAPSVKHVNLIAYAYGVQGPLVADVYYPVAAPSDSPPPPPLAVPGTVAVATDFSFVANTPCGAVRALGDTCKLPGMEWYYQPAVPSYARGYTTMLQVGYEDGSYKPVSNGKIGGTAISWTNSIKDASGQYEFLLDEVAPYDTPATAGTRWSSVDYPAFPLNASVCNEVLFSGTFKDFFMYQPTVPSWRTGDPIWVTTDVESWQFQQSAQVNGTKWKSYSNPINPYPQPSPTALPSWPGIVANVVAPCQ